jgi:hypothetical protein
MKQDVLSIAEALDYKKLERLRNAGDNVSSDALLGILRSCIVEPYAILFFPGKCFQITPFGMSFTRFLSNKDVNYLIAHADLNEKFLRQVFTGFELVLYKICHIVLEDQKPEYHWETQKTRARFRRLRDLLVVPDWAEFQCLFDEIFYVRDSFAHSFIPLDEIKYNSVALKDCFGYSYVGRQLSDGKSYGARIFTEDLERLFEPIMKLFYLHQLKQIDAKKFHKLCDRLLMRRSMSPGS